MRLIVKRLINKFKFVLTYRTRSANEAVSSRSCCNLVNSFSRSITFGGRPAPGFVEIYQNVRNIWRIQWREIFNRRDVLCVYVSHIFIYLSNIYTIQLEAFWKYKKTFLRFRTEGSIILETPVLVDATTKNNQLLKPCIGSPHQSSHLNKLCTSADRWVFI